MSEKKSLPKLKMKPLADRVVIIADNAEEVTKSGIIIPDAAKEKPLTGTVIVCGPGKKGEPMDVKPGDSVLFGKFSGTEFTRQGQEYLIMREADIWAVL